MDVTLDLHRRQVSLTFTFDFDLSGTFSQRWIDDVIGIFFVFGDRALILLDDLFQLHLKTFVDVRTKITDRKGQNVSSGKKILNVLE